jgi:hypothetical protein
VDVCLEAGYSAAVRGGGGGGGEGAARGRGSSTGGKVAWWTGGGQQGVQCSSGGGRGVTTPGAGLLQLGLSSPELQQSVQLLLLLHTLLSLSTSCISSAVLHRCAAPLPHNSATHHSHFPSLPALPLLSHSRHPLLFRPPCTLSTVSRCSRPPPSPPLPPATSSPSFAGWPHQSRQLQPPSLLVTNWRQAASPRRPTHNTHHTSSSSSRRSRWGVVTTVVGEVGRRCLVEGWKAPGAPRQGAVGGEELDFNS